MARAPMPMAVARSDKSFMAVMNHPHGSFSFRKEVMKKGFWEPQAKPQ